MITRLHWDHAEMGLEKVVVVGRRGGVCVCVCVCVEGKGLFGGFV